MLEVWFGPSWEILLDSELEPDFSGKPRLVTTVPQSDEASELPAATLGARAIEPQRFVSTLVRASGRMPSQNWLGFLPFS